MSVLVQVEGLLINNARLSGTLPQISPTRRSNDQTPLYHQLQTLSIPLLAPKGDVGVYNVPRLVLCESQSGPEFQSLSDYAT